MSQTVSRVAKIAALMPLLCLAANSVQAQHFFDDERRFVVEKPCEATRSLKGGSPTKLQPGDTLNSRGLNKKNGATHAFVRVGSSNKWVRLACGKFSDAAPQTASNQAAGSSGQTCLPFFDDKDNPVALGNSGRKVDITPEEPVLNDFDRAVLRVCGAPLKRVTRNEFKDMMREYSHILMELREFTDGRVFADRPARSAPEDYLNDLTDAWFKKDGFNHVFCGERGKTRNGVTSIGGLHHHGRYVQLQKSNQACRLPGGRNEAEPGLIYSMGVRLKSPTGGELISPIKGYGLTLSALDIFKIATRALQENPKSKKGRKLGCWLPVRADGRDFTTVLVRNQQGIITFYPDATPRGPGDYKNSNCRAKIVLDED